MLESKEAMTPSLQVENDKREKLEYQLENHSCKKDDRTKTDQGRSFQEKASKIDRIALNTFTVCFFSFNFVYWTYYLNFIQYLKNN